MMKQTAKNIFLGMLIFVFGFPALAKFSYEGYLTDLSSNPITTAGTKVRFNIKTVTGACSLWIDEHTVTPTAEGYISVVIGNGTATNNTTAPLSFSQIFMNGSPIATGGCTPTPAAGEARDIFVSVSTDGGTTWDSLGSIPIYPVQNSEIAEKLGKFADTNVLRVENAGVPGTAPFLTTAQSTELMNLVGGTSANYMKTTGGTGALPTTPGATAGNIWYDTGTNQVKYYDGTSTITVGSGGAGTVTNVSGTAPISVATGTTTPVISMSQANGVTSGYLTAADWTTFNNKGDFLSSGTVSMAGSLKMGGNPIYGNTTASANLTLESTSNATKGYVILQPTSGNVGIGTSTPTSALHVLRNTVPAIAEFKGSNAGGTGVKIFNTLSVSDYSNLQFWSGAAQQWEIGGNNANFYLYDQTAGVNRMTVIQATGNVGIGTTTPNGKMDVKGSIVMSGSTSGFAGFQVSPVAGSTVWTLPTADGTNGQLLGTNGAGGLSWQSPPVGVIQNGGNSFGGNANIGTNDAYQVDFRTNGTSKVTILPSGNVGIGTTVPGYQLTLSTDSAAKPGTSTWTIASDERLKDIRAPYVRGLDALNGLHTIYFNYKKDNPLSLPSEKEYVGIRAQDALKVIPEAVSKDEMGYYHVTNDSIIWTAVNAIKELYAKYLAQDEELSKLKQENAAIKAYLCAKERIAGLCQ
jgi:hypothetical protein